MLARFERLMEQAVEGSLRRVFPTPLQPVQLAKAAARAMEQSQVIGVRGAEVPNHYELRLAPADLERFGEYAGALPEQVRSYLLDYADERDLRPVAEMRVELLPDSTVRTGSVVARARFANLAPAIQREVDGAVEGTRRLRLAELAAAQTRRPSAKQRQLWLTDAAGLRFALEPQAGIVRLGRATDNDVVIDSEHISRYHAQLRWVQSTWLIYDLGSTNGTWVDEQRLRDRQARAVEAGKRLRLGDHELKVRSGTG
jgi:FHA domain-containing protein